MAWRQVDSMAAFYLSPYFFGNKRNHRFCAPGMGFERSDLLPEMFHDLFADVGIVVFSYAQGRDGARSHIPGAHSTQAGHPASVGSEGPRIEPADRASWDHLVIEPRTR
jgi:hypothetical protein